MSRSPRHTHISSGDDQTNKPNFRSTLNHIYIVCENIDVYE